MYLGSHPWIAKLKSNPLLLAQVNTADHDFSLRLRTDSNSEDINRFLCLTVKNMSFFRCFYFIQKKLIYLTQKEKEMCHRQLPAGPLPWCSIPTSAGCPPQPATIWPWQCHHRQLPRPPAMAWSGELRKMRGCVEAWL